MVTSRPFSRCPAAHTRTASPTAARPAPSTIELHVGWASHSAATLAMNPRGTRRRATRAAKSGMMLGGDKAPVDRSTHVLDGDVLDAGSAATAAPLIVTPAVATTRERDVGRVPRTVARRVRGAEQRDDRRADGAGQVQGTRVARQHQPRIARECEHVADA